METLIRVSQLIFSLTLLVLFHELGHFFFSKLFKVRVEKFYLFFNPSFALVRAKKIRGKWQFKFFAKNFESLSTPIYDFQGKHAQNEEGHYLYQTQTLESLDENDWRKYPESTEWGIGWLPLGGYCKIAGMIDESMDKGQMASEPKPWEYRAVSPWKRLPIISGGVLVNFILAFIIYSATLFTWGEKYIPMQNFTAGYEFSPLAEKAGFVDGDILLKADGKPLEEYNEFAIRSILDAKTVLVNRNGQDIFIQLPANFAKSIIFSKEFFALPRLPFVVDEVMDNSPAKKYGLQKGDSLVYINKIEHNSFFIFAESLKSHKQNRVEIGLYRHGQLIYVNLQPDSSGIIGVRPLPYSSFFETKSIEYSLFESIPAGIELGLAKLKAYVSDFKYLFTKEGVENLGGFASMGKMYDIEWNWPRLWEMTAFLSIILAFMNILPIPGLDGGHLMFVIYEIVSKKKPSQKFLEKAQIIGMVFLLSLMIFANVNDLFR